MKASIWHKYMDLSTKVVCVTCKCRSPSQIVCCRASDHELHMLSTSHANHCHLFHGTQTVFRTDAISVEQL